MISVVICSVNKALAAQVKRNIHNTIGVPFELVLLDNSVLNRSIAEIYNMGAAQSRYGIICFVHEDVLFSTHDWGKRVAGYFESNEDLGLLGVAGAKYKSKALSGWTTGIREFDCCNIVHRAHDGKEQRIYLNPARSKHLQQVITLDGVFICCRRRVWEQVRFNEQLLRGFHLYDIDFSFNASRTFGAAVTFDIDIVHLTAGGDYGNAWLEYTIAWHEKHAHLLPAMTDNSSVEDVAEVEHKIRKMWLNRLRKESISFRNRLRWLSANGTAGDLRLVPFALLFLTYSSFKPRKGR